MSLALGSVTRLITQSLYATLNSRVGWCHQVNLTDEALQEIEFWLSEISNFNGQQIWPKLQHSGLYTQMQIRQVMVGM